MSIVMVRRSRRNRTHRRGKSMRRSHRKAGVRKTRRNNRNRKQRGGAQAVCGPSPPQTGAACNAGSGSNYAITMVGDAYTQMRKSLASMFS